MPERLRSVPLRSAQKVDNQLGLMRYELKLLEIALNYDRIEEKIVYVYTDKADYLVFSYDKTMNFSDNKGIITN